MATNEQFREFAAKVAAAIVTHEVDAKAEAITRPIGSETTLDRIWVEAQRIIANMDKHNENT